MKGRIRGLEVYGLLLSARMEAAFFLIEARPASAALIATRSGQRAWVAADGAVPAIVQEVMRQAVFLEVSPDLIATPVDERVEFPDVRIIRTGGERE